MRKEKEIKIKEIKIEEKKKLPLPRNRQYWIDLNEWRWKFLSLSTAYEDIYNEFLSSKRFVFLAVKCFSLFDLVLTENFYKKEKLPDPDKRIDQQIGPIYFYDYYYHITGKSWCMEKAFGYSKPCLHITDFPDNKILSSKTYKELGSFYSEKHGFFVFPKRIIPGIELLAIDSSLPLDEAVICFEKEYLKLKRKQEERPKAYTNTIRFYYSTEKKKNQRPEDWRNYYQTCLIYKFVRERANRRDNVFKEAQEMFQGEIDSNLPLNDEAGIYEAQERFRGENIEKLKNMYESKKYKIKFDEWCNRTFYEWRKRGKELIKLASSGSFILPD